MPYPPSDFRSPPSPYASKPGEPPQLWPLDDPDYYRKDEIGAARGLALGIPAGLALWAFIIWLVLG